MATTKNHKIVKTLKKAIDYILSDKREEKIKDDIKDSVAYIIDDKTGEIIYPTIHSTLNCFNDDPYKSFKILINEYGKDEMKNGNRRTKNGEAVLAWHFHQNFEGHVDPIIANEIGYKLAKEMFGNFPTVIGTHTNTENTHNHIIICAWNLEGKKWHQHNAAYQKLREVSDNLCEEYGLSVLKDTKKMKLVKYKDENNKVHYYEPTTRKNNLIKERYELKEKYDVGNYSNTLQYEVSENRKETMREIVRQDIDRLLPICQSYEHLLDMLRENGYKINDKKKNGEWLKHISFQPPSGSKGIRDYKINNDGFYERENLEKIITKLVRNKEKNKIKENIDYIYDKVNIEKLDENFKIQKNNEKMNLISRSDLERKIIKDIKEKNSNIIDVEKIDKLINENKKNIINKNNILINQIKESFDVLRFLEKENIYTEKQIIEMTTGMWKKYNQCLNNIDNTELILNKMEKLLRVPEKKEIIENRIKNFINNQEYVENELIGDKQQLEKYCRIIEKYNLNSLEEIENIKKQVISFREKNNQLQNSVLNYKNTLEKYENCIKVLDRIEKEKVKTNNQLIEKYQKIKIKEKNKSKNIEEKRQKRKAAER